MLDADRTFSEMTKLIRYTPHHIQDYIDMTRSPAASLSTTASPTREQPGTNIIESGGVLDSIAAIKGLDYASAIIASYSADAAAADASLTTAESGDMPLPLPPDMEPTPLYESYNSANDDDAYVQYSRTQVSVIDQLENEQLHRSENRFKWQYKCKLQYKWAPSVAGRRA